MDGMSTYHSSTHLLSSLKGLLEIGAGTLALKTRSGLLDKRVVFAQASSLARGAPGIVLAGQTGDGTALTS